MKGYLLLILFIIALIISLVSSFIEWFNELIMFYPSIAWCILISTIVLAITICIYHRIKVYKKYEKTDYEIANKKSILNQLNCDIAKKQEELNRNQVELQKIEQISTKIKEENFQHAIDSFSIDYHLPCLDFNSSGSETYKIALQGIKQIQKTFSDERIAIPVSSYVNRTKEVVAMVKIVIRSFNIETDIIIGKITYNNLENCTKKIKTLFCKYSSLLLKIGLTLNEKYLSLRLEELKITYDYKIKLHQEQEEKKAERERQRDEVRAEKEIMIQLREAEREEKRLQILEHRYNLLLKFAEGAKVEELNNKISELTARLAQVRENKERVLSMAQQTKRGYIYVISNIGSFGANVYKIGMTRRLNPNERIAELSGASVPFPFDTHALICTDDAPALEAAIHRALSKHRVNIINNRKEFFRCSLDEIINVVKSLGVETTFTRNTQNTDFYLSTHSYINLPN